MPPLLSAPLPVGYIQLIHHLSLSCSQQQINIMTGLWNFRIHVSKTAALYDTAIFFLSYNKILMQCKWIMPIPEWGGRWKRYQSWVACILTHTHVDVISLHIISYPNHSYLSTSIRTDNENRLIQWESISICREIDAVS